MLRKTLMIVAPVSFLFVVPLAASAKSLDTGALDMFSAATLTIRHAGEAALKAHPGKLAAVAFEDEDGRASYEAVVVGGDGKPWTLMIDAKTGDVFASGQSSSMQDQEDKAPDVREKDQDGESDDG